MYDSPAGNRSMPDGIVIPVLLYPDVPAAVEWLCRVFGFRERLRIGTHRVQMQVGTAAIVVAQGPPDPSALGRAGSLMVRVSDVDAHFAASVRHGAEILGEPVSYPYGERQYGVADIGGHAWTFSQTVADIDPRDWGGMPLPTDAPSSPHR